MKLNDSQRQKIIDSCNDNSLSWHYSFGLLQGMIGYHDNKDALDALYDKIVRDTKKELELFKN